MSYPESERCLTLAIDSMKMNLDLGASPKNCPKHSNKGKTELKGKDT